MLTMPTPVVNIRPFVIDILQVHSPHTLIIHRDKAEFPQQNSREAYDAAAEGSFSDGKIIWAKFETPSDKPVSITITHTN
jgi:hypothetical protein